MKNFNAFCFILFLSILFLFKRDVYAQKTSFIKYYENINKAELCLINKDYRSALKIYKTSFKLVPKPFARDFWNALICYTKISANRKSYKLVKKIALKGFEINNFNITAFDDFKNSRFWRKVEKNYEKWQKKNLTSIKPELKYKLDSLANRDQYLRGNGGYAVYRDSIRKIDESNYAEMFKLFDKYGIIDENDIGINNPMTYLPHYTLIRHYVQSYLMPRLEDKLMSAVLEGRFSRKFYSMNFSTDMDGIIFGKNYGNMAIVEVDGNLYHIEHNKEILEIINTNRKSIGLEPYDEYVKKVDFAQENREFALDNWAGFTSMSFGDERSKKIYLNGKTGKVASNLIPISRKNNK